MDEQTSCALLPILSSMQPGESKEVTVGLGWMNHRECEVLLHLQGRRERIDPISPVPWASSNLSRIAADASREGRSSRLSRPCRPGPRRRLFLCDRSAYWNLPASNCERHLPLESAIIGSHPVIIGGLVGGHSSHDRPVKLPVVPFEMSFVPYRQERCGEEAIKGPIR
jgi:hypothetical protein